MTGVPILQLLAEHNMDFLAKLHPTEHCTLCVCQIFFIALIYIDRMSAATSNGNIFFTLVLAKTRIEGNMVSLREKKQVGHIININPHVSCTRADTLVTRNCAMNCVHPNCSKVSVGEPPSLCPVPQREGSRFRDANKQFDWTLFIFQERLVCLCFSPSC